MSVTSIDLYADRINIIDSRSAHKDDVIVQDQLINTHYDEFFRSALVHFESIPQEYLNTPISGYRFHVYLDEYYKPGGTTETFTEKIFPLTAPFTSTVTYNTKPTASTYSLEIAPDINIQTYWGSSFAHPWENKYPGLNNIDSIKNVLNNGVEIRGFYNFDTSTTVNPVYLTILFDDDTTSISGSPNGGSIIKQRANTFNWAVTAPENVLEPVNVTGNTFEWRADSGSTATVINTGTAQTYTVPANTFSTDSIQWRATSTLSNGTTLETDWYTISTVEPGGTGSQLKPVNTIEDGSSQILFQWRYYNTSGLPQGGADINWSYPGQSTSELLAHIDGAQTYYYAPADTFPPGTVYWWLRVYNQENRASGWIGSAQFVNVTAPPAPVVTSNNVPYTTLSWQSDGQQAYRVTVDGQDYGVKFGQDQTFTLPEPLPDGQHTASVSVQGIYGLWSKPGSVAFTVANSASGTIDLIGGFNSDIGLLWTASETGGVFYVYRDGQQIAHTEENTYLDRTALGAHSYFVRQRFANGTYIDSNTVTGTATVEEPQIALLSGGPWVSLRLSERSDSQQTFRYSKIHSLRHITAAEYPYLEMSNYADETGEYDASFVSAEEAKPLLDMRGQVVILKSRGNNVIIGPLAEVRTVYRDFYVSCTFSIQRITWEEFYNADS